MNARPATLGAVLFEGFELLDLVGPLEILGHLPEHFTIVTIGPVAGPVASHQGPRMLADVGFGEAPVLDALLVPGGQGTRREVGNASLLAWLGARAATASLVMSVCTGSALLARAGVLDGHRATSNKRAFDWVISQGPRVHWVRRARWVGDGRLWTSSGVSAGMDMTLALLADRLGRDVAEAAASRIEFAWHRDPDDDPFA